MNSAAACIAPTRPALLCGGDDPALPRARRRARRQFDRRDRTCLVALVAAAAAALASGAPVLRDAPLRGSFAADGVLTARVALGSAASDSASAGGTPPAGAGAGDGDGAPPAGALDVIVDTGSSGLYVRCQAGAGAGAGAGRAFVDVAASASAVEEACDDAALAARACDSCGPGGRCLFSRSFSEGSRIEGFYVREAVSFVGARGGRGAAAALASAAAALPGARGALRVRVGCITGETGAFAAQAAGGILGLAQGRRGFLSQLLVAGAIARNSFAVCAAAGGGALSLGTPRRAPGGGGGGGAPVAVGSSPLYTAPASGHYLVRLSHVALLPPAGGAGVLGPDAWHPARPPPAPPRDGDTRAPGVTDDSEGAPGTGELVAVVDTGSTFSFLPRALLAILLGELAARCGERGACGPGVALAPPAALPVGQIACLDLPPGATPADVAAAAAGMPGLALRFESGATLRFDGRHAWHASDWFGGASCLGVYPAEEAGGRAVIGLNALHGHEATFDVDRGALSWAFEDRACARAGEGGDDAAAGGAPPEEAGADGEGEGEGAGAGAPGDALPGAVGSSPLVLGAYGAAAGALVMGAATTARAAFVAARNGSARAGGYAPVAAGGPPPGADEGGGGPFAVSVVDAHGGGESGESDAEDAAPGGAGHGGGGGGGVGGGGSSGSISGSGTGAQPSGSAIPRRSVASAAASAAGSRAASTGGGDAVGKRARRA